MPLSLHKKGYAIVAFIILIGGYLVAQSFNKGEINECSGLIVSSKSDNLLWVHNDSGDQGRVFLINKNGKILAKYLFKKEVIDCEDIALYIPKLGKPQIFIGDIGDNKAIRDYISIYQFDEPDTIENDKGEILLKNVTQLKFRYPDGPRDAECLMVDQRDQQIYIVSKREDSVGVYSAPIQSKNNQVITLKKEAKLYLSGEKGSKAVTAGDISRDGKEVVIKSYANIFYWDRAINETIPVCLQKPFIGLPYEPEKQGEAIGLLHNGRSYYTISESKRLKVRFKKI